MWHKAGLFLWLVVCSAWAQEVVVLAFEADAGMRLSRQVEDAILEYTTVKPMSRESYEREALRLGVADAQTAVGFSRTALHLGEVVVAVWGKIEGSSVDVFLWDKAGAPLWNRRLPLKQGLLTEEFSQRLANAISVAVEVQAQGEVSKGEPEAKAEEAPPEAAVASEEVSAMEVGPRLSGPRAPFVRVALLGSVSWRSLCIRPGKDACVAVEKMSQEERPGSRDFASGAYGGAALQAEYFPLVLSTSSPLKGLGLRLEAGYGRAKRHLDDKSPSSRELTFAMQEVHWSAEALYRHFFLEPSSDGMGLHASARLGYAGKNFLNEEQSGSGLFLPDIHRHFLSVGMDTEFSLLALSFLRFGFYADMFIQPKPGGAVQRAYGNASSIGYRIGGAVSGLIYGPLGYKVDMSWNFFKDKCEGQRWPNGGILRETYFALRGGLLLEF